MASIQINATLADGRITGTWILDVLATLGAIVSGTNNDGDHMTYDLHTGDTVLYIGPTALYGIGDAGPTPRTAHAARQEVSDRAYWHARTQRMAWLAGLAKIAA